MSSNNSNKLNVPEARQAMDQFKMEAATEVGVTFSYKVQLTYMKPLEILFDEANCT